MNFFIKKNSSLPVLIFPITQKMMEKLNLTEEMFENVVVTFSMVNADTDKFKIANSAGDFSINSNPVLSHGQEKYSLTYNFTTKQTGDVGNYIGEFVVDFLDENNAGKLKLPIDDVINIVIANSITKTSFI